MTGPVKKRLRLRRIKNKAKPVHVVGFKDFAGILGMPALCLELYSTIIDRIERGEGLPETNYRAGIDIDEDRLLTEKGIMHLHLGGRNSDTLLFLIQYADIVVLLKTNTHMHFRTKPAGRNILALSQSWLNNLEADMARATLQAATADTTEERDAAEDLANQRKTAIAAFKARIFPKR